MRKTSILLAAALCLCLFAGCAPQQQPEEKDPYAEIPVEYEPERAEHEDEGLALHFQHAFVKTPRTDTESTGRDTYKMYTGRNEIETMQFLLSAEDAREGYSAEMTAFAAQGGEELSAELFKLRYFDVNYEQIPDALCPYGAGESFDLEGGASQAFLVRVKTLPETAAGEYEAALRIRDAAGREVKRARVFLHVWDFTLPEETSCTVSMDMSGYEIARVSGRGDLYKNYYDFLLENRICAYELPYDIFSEEAEAYMSNPRVRSFNLSKFGSDAAYMARAAQRMAENPVWAEKAYFYYVDEPLDEADLNEIARYGALLEGAYPGYRMVSPFFTPGTVQATGEDYVSFMADYINIWCPKASLYTTDEDYMTVDGAKQPFFESWQETENGTFRERMEAEAAGGDTLWWYTCWDPTAPYITLNTEEEGVNHRILFWQQKYFGVEGFLYFSVNEWDAGSDSWTSHEKFNSESQTVWGDGQLIYCGTRLGLDIPVASLRLNSVRDGIEDYEYLTMLEAQIGTAAVNELISKITTGIVSYTSDDDLFAAWRVRLGNYLEAELAG